MSNKISGVTGPKFTKFLAVAFFSNGLLAHGIAVGMGMYNPFTWEWGTGSIISGVEMNEWSCYYYLLLRGNQTYSYTNSNIHTTQLYKN